MRFFRNKKLLALVAVLILLIILPIIVFFQGQQTQTQTEAEQTTTLYFAPDTSQTPLQKAPQENFSLDIMINPGQNLVTLVKIDLAFDPTKVAYNGSSAFTPNTSAFPKIVEGPVYGSNKFTVTLSIGNDPSRALNTVTKAGTINLKALASTGGTPTQISFTSLSQVLSAAPTDQASENVLAGTTPANISIVPFTPTPTPCNAVGGAGGPGGSTIPGVSVRSGDGGDGTSNPCKMGTNGYTVNAANYCSTQTVSITWPQTNGATYYKLLIDGVQVYNGSGLSYSAANYSKGTQHTITLYAGNPTMGDYNPSTNGFFTISNIACITPTPTPTRTPTPTPTRTPTPSPTNTPTSTPVPLATKLSFTALLHGIGNSGDSANPTAHSLSNKTPLHLQRGVQVEVFNAQNQKVANGSGTLAYNPTNGNFTGIVDVGNTLASGVYTVKLKTDQYLRRLIPGIQTINAGQTNTMPTIQLVAGDIVSDNVLNILDYNILIGCYSDINPPISCTPQQKLQADINDNGNVNQFDYNLFLRELSVQSGD